MIYAKHFSLILACCLTCGGASSAPLQINFTLASPNLDVYNASLSPISVDVYELSIYNPNPNDVTAIGLHFPNENANFVDGIVTAKQGADLPTLGPYTIADTFFVSPVPTDQLLGAGIIDTPSEFTINYVIAGGGTLVPAQGHALLAVFSFPAGSELKIFCGAKGIAEFAPELGLSTEHFFIGCPEPNTLMLAGLVGAIGGLATRNGKGQ